MKPVSATNPSSEPILPVNKKAVVSITAADCLAKGLVIVDQILAKQTLLDQNLENERAFKDVLGSIEATNLVDISTTLDSNNKPLFTNDAVRAAENAKRLSKDKTAVKCSSEIIKCLKVTAQLRREIDHLKAQYSLYKAMLNSRDFTG